MNIYFLTTCPIRVTIMSHLFFSSQILSQFFSVWAWSIDPTTLVNLPWGSPTYDWWHIGGSLSFTLHGPHCAWNSQAPSVAWIPVPTCILALLLAHYTPFFHLFFFSLLFFSLPSEYLTLVPNYFSTFQVIFYLNHFVNSQLCMEQ